MKLAILGGSFDPVHVGHVAMVEFILEHTHIDRVLVVPASCSPFKNQSVTAPEHRLEMVRLAFSHLKDCQISDLEVRRGGPSYMIDTLEFLQKVPPVPEISLIVGQDNLEDFFKWHRVDDVLALAEILVLGRQVGTSQTVNIPDSHKHRFHFFLEFDRRVSSTEIRVMLDSDELADGQLSPAVRQYIKKHSLY
ncbi:MAG: nicotinate (nicotinamide) nucleotide adenylyltransferase [bacterium]|nr:nicotinate (nicotinamide) nucleotide adenylyltransferase [bacterium]